MKAAGICSGTPTSFLSHWGGTKAAWLIDKGSSAKILAKLEASGAGRDFILRLITDPALRKEFPPSQPVHSPQDAPSYRRRDQDSLCQIGQLHRRLAQQPHCAPRRWRPLRLPHAARPCVLHSPVDSKHGDFDKQRQAPFCRHMSRFVAPYPTKTLRAPNPTAAHQS